MRFVNNFGFRLKKKKNQHLICSLKCISRSTDLDISNQLKYIRARAPDTQTETAKHDPHESGTAGWVYVYTDAGTYRQINTCKHLTALIEITLEKHGAEQNKLV